MTTFEVGLRPSSHEYGKKPSVTCISLKNFTANILSSIIVTIVYSLHFKFSSTANCNLCTCTAIKYEVNSLTALLHVQNKTHKGKYMQEFRGTRNYEGEPEKQAVENFRMVREKERERERIEDF